MTGSVHDTMLNECRHDFIFVKRNIKSLGLKRRSKPSVYKQLGSTLYTAAQKQNRAGDHFRQDLLVGDLTKPSNQR
jgi:hypothetical protein